MTAKIRVLDLPVPDCHEVDEVVQACRPILAGRHPAIVSAVLADMLAIWLAGHPKPYREDVLRGHIDLVRDLIAINAKIIGTEP